MGTVMNGNVWAGACVNGKVVSGLAKDGSVFYRKPVSTHRRRIMVGDNLKGKDIFSTIPQGFWQNYVTSTEIINNVDYDLVMFQNTNWNDYIRFYTNKNESLLPVVRLYDYGGIPNEIYSYQADINKETNNSKTTHKNDKDYIVSSIVENNVYRHLYIEDENIRPLKVGDIITDNTVFYFTFPDDFHVDIQSMTDENRDKNFIELDDGSDYVLAYVVDEYRVDFFTNNFSAQDYGVCYAYDRNTGIRINLSSKLAKDITDPWGNPFTGTVTMVDKNNEAYQHILVDATTLGA